jgi:hypothetical protein
LNGIGIFIEKGVKMSIHLQKTKHIWPAILIIAMLSLAIFVVFPSSSAQASSGNNESRPPTSGVSKVENALLERAFQREQIINRQLVNFLEKADSSLSRFDEAIANGETNKVDVSALIDARNILEDKITSAKANQLEAAKLLDEHPGFDSSGSVTNPKLALETIRSVSRIHKEARQMIGESIKNAYKAMREYHSDNSIE